MSRLQTDHNPTLLEGRDLRYALEALAMDASGLAMAALEALDDDNTQEAQGHLRELRDMLTTN